MSGITGEQISPAVNSNGDVDWPTLLEQALTLPGQLGKTYCRFYQYSLQNQILLWSQGVREPVAPFSVWKALGRSPMRGGGRYVLQPRPVRRADEETGEEKVVACLFRLKRSTFPYSQTMGPEVEWPELPEWNLDRALAALEITRVPFRLIDGNTQGYSYKRNVAVSPVAAYPVKTMFHELAHVMLGHTTGEEERSCRGVEEFQAESVAYLLAHETGLTQWAPEESRAYIQSWLGNEEVTDRHIRAVFATVNAILKAGRSEAGAPEAEEAKAS